MRRNEDMYTGRFGRDGWLNCKHTTKRERDKRGNGEYGGDEIGRQKRHGNATVLFDQHSAHRVSNTVALTATSSDQHRRS